MKILYSVMSQMYNIFIEIRDNCVEVNNEEKVSEQYNINCISSISELI